MYILELITSGITDTPCKIRELFAVIDGFSVYIFYRELRMGKTIDRYIFESKVLHDTVEFSPYAGICIISTQNK